MVSEALDRFFLPNINSERMTHLVTNPFLPESRSGSDDDVLVRVGGVSKKFCRSLAKSLWYGVRDIVTDLNPFFRNGANPKGSLAGRGIGSSPGRHPASSVGLRADEFWAVNGVGFELRRGECLGLIGHNGAGKTTLLKMLNGVIKPDHGRIEMRGKVGALIALGAGFNPILTGRENIYVNASLLGLTKREIDDKLEEIIDFSDIREFIDMAVQSYSSGMAVRLGFAVAINCQPDILLLDEVLAVGDIGFQAKCFNAISAFRKTGTAFILVSHNMHLIARYCDRVAYLKHGKIVHLGDMQTGIGLFTRDMAAPGSGADNESTEWSKVYGSGKVALTKGRFFDEAGRPIDQIRPGDTFTVVLDYECPQTDVNDGVLDVVIRDNEGVLFQGTSKNYGIAFGNLLRRGQFSITFEKLPANSSPLLFSFALVSGQSGEFYDWKRRISLQVATIPHLTGRLALAVHWSSGDKVEQTGATARTRFSGPCSLPLRTRSASSANMPAAAFAPDR